MFIFVVFIIFIVKSVFVSLQNENWRKIVSYTSTNNLLLSQNDMISNQLSVRNNFSSNKRMLTGCPLYQFFYNSVCYFKCPIKTYPDYSTYFCKECDSECLECNGPSSNECLECPPNSYLLDNECLLLCPDGYYAEKIPKNVCQRCYFTCETCIDSYKCDVCPFTRFLNTDPQFIDSGICSQCLLGCKICFSYFICTVCDTGYYLLNSKCVTACPINYTPDSVCENCVLGTSIPTCKICNNGFFYDTNTNACKSCDVKCTLCDGPSSAECTECSTGYYLYNRECLAQCPEGYYASPSYSVKRMCFRCYHTCKACSDSALSCTSCVSNSYLSYSSGTYFCLKCSSSCQTCTSLFGCTTCQRNYYLNNGVCSATCPLGYFQNPISSICEKCSITCKSCGTDLTCSSCICNACNSGYFLLVDKCIKCNSICSDCDGPNSNQCLACFSPYYLYQNVCSLDCPLKYWKSLSDLKCKICHFSCKSCELGDQDNQCTDCNDGFVLVSGMCKPCSITCSKCLNSPTFCIECKSEFILISNSCISCGDGYWKSIELNSCEPCHASCKTCFGGNQDNQCTSCIVSFYLKNNYCENCNSNCLECKNAAEQCIVCHDKYFLDLRYLNCVTSCSEGTWTNSIELKCVVCDGSCKTCSGSSDNECISCSEKKYLIQGKCVSDCPEGFFNDENSKKCLPCHSSCKTCLSSSLSDCLLCFSDQYFLMINEDLNIGSCYPECPKEYRKNTINWLCLKKCQENEYEDLNNICQICNENCASCDGPVQDNCLSCKNGKVLEGKLCLEACPDKYFNSSSVCKKCPDECSNCTKENLCTSCEKDFYINIVSNLCEKCDGSALFVNKMNKCEPCMQGCIKCNSKEFCLECNSKYYLRNQKCEAVIMVSATLKAFQKKPKIFYLIFSNFSFELNENFMKKNYELSVSEKTNEQFTLQINQINNTYFEIFLDFKTNITNKNIISMKFNDNILKNEKYILQNDSVSVIPLPYFYCSLESFYDQDLQKCIKTVFINPSLILTNDPLQIKLSFDGEFLELFDIINQITFLKITQFNQSEMTYEIKKTDAINTFLIKFNLSTSLIGDHSLILNINLPLTLSKNEQIKLATTEIQIAMLNYFKINQEQAKLIENSKENAAKSSESASYSVSVFSLTSSGSSLAFTVLSMMKFIKYLKYLSINYPPNALIVFESKLDFINILPSFEMSKDPEDDNVEDKFLLYEFDNYVWNSVNQIILQLIVLGILGWFFYFKERRIHKYLKKYTLINLIYKRIYAVFCWNFFFSYTMSNFQDIWFACLVCLRFPPLQTSFGIFNFFLAFILLIVEIGSLILIYWALSKVRVNLILEGLLKQNFGSKHNNLVKKRKRYNVRENFEQVTPNEINFYKVETAPSSPYRFNKLKGLNLIFDPSFSKTEISSGTREKIVKVNEMRDSHQNIEESENKRQNLNTIRKYSNDLLIEGKPDIQDVKESNLPKENSINPTIEKSPSSLTKNEETPNKNLVNLEKFMRSSIKLKTKIVPKERREIFFKKFSILFEDFKQQKYSTSFYIFVDILKLPLLSFIICFDSGHPFRQICIINGTNFLMFLYLIYTKPFNSKSLFLQNILNQLCLIFCSSAIFGIGYLDYIQDEDQEKRLLLGWIFFYGNLGLVYLILLVTICSISMAIAKIILLFWSKKKGIKKNKVVPFN